MVGVEVRNHHHVDRLGIEAGIEHDQLAAGIDHQRREVDRHHIARQKRLLERGADLFLLRVDDEAVFERKGKPAV
jgi:hypothetical protein